MAATGDGFVDFVDLTPAQKAEAIAWLKKTRIFGSGVARIFDQAFRVKANGKISRNHSDRRLTQKASAALNVLVSGILSAPSGDPAKGSLDHFRTATFGLNREKP